MSQTESTYKSKDTEEYFDTVFYRPVGYYIALISSRFDVTPNQITSLSIIFGIAGSLFFLPKNISFNLTGILFLILSDLFDSADGQLARLIKRQSRFGRILDGLGGNLIFLSIYIVLCFRLINDGFGPNIFVIALFSIISHSLQASLADYYRNIFLSYTSENGESELETSKNILADIKNSSLKNSFMSKILLVLYYLYTKQQESLSKDFKIFNDHVKTFYKSVPEFLKILFRTKFKPMIKYYNFLTVNSRIAAVSIFVLINKPLYYFVFEIVFMNLVFFYVLICHRIKFNYLFSKINSGISL